MGNDGGSIPLRSELVKNRAIEVENQGSKEASHEFRWNVCSLSKEPLGKPIVSDAFGTLFNKTSILGWLLTPTEYPEGRQVAGHIKSMRDVVEVHFTEASKQWVCPVSRKEISAGKGRFVYLIPCGHVFAESTTKEIESETCLECGQSKEDKIIINPREKSDMEALRNRLSTLTEAGLTHSLAKVKAQKKKRKEIAPTDMERKEKKPAVHCDLAVNVLRKVNEHSRAKESDVVKALYSRRSASAHGNGQGVTINQSA